MCKERASQFALAINSTTQRKTSKGLLMPSTILLDCNSGRLRLTANHQAADSATDKTWALEEEKWPGINSAHSTKSSSNTDRVSWAHQKQARLPGCNLTVQTCSLCRLCSRLRGNIPLWASQQVKPRSTWLFWYCSQPDPTRLQQAQSAWPFCGTSSQTNGKTSDKEKSKEGVLQHSGITLIPILRLSWPVISQPQDNGEND